jgi:hypothetical protein
VCVLSCLCGDASSQTKPNQHLQERRAHTHTDTAHIKSTHAEHKESTRREHTVSTHGERTHRAHTHRAHTESTHRAHTESTHTEHTEQKSTALGEVERRQSERGSVRERQ